MPDIASVIKMSDLYHISLDELLKGDQDMMKKSGIPKWLRHRKESFYGER